MKPRKNESVRAFLERAGACEGAAYDYGRCKTIKGAIRVADGQDVNWAIQRILPGAQAVKIGRSLGIETCPCGEPLCAVSVPLRLRKKALLAYFYGEGK